LHHLPLSKAAASGARVRISDADAFIHAAPFSVDAWGGKLNAVVRVVLKEAFQDPLSHLPQEVVVTLGDLRVAMRDDVVHVNYYGRVFTVNVCAYAYALPRKRARGRQAID
jgi:hypothetical protein